MSYMNIDNLYKDQTILLFKEAYAMEKIHGCLKKGTHILLKNGKEKPIEDIDQHDMVVVFDEKTRKFSSSHVESLVIQESDNRIEWMEIILGTGKSIICTTDHPFLTDRGWVMAECLKLSDNLLDSP